MPLMNAGWIFVEGWISRFCLALCLVLSTACTLSATQQRLEIVSALQSHGHPVRHIPQMLMTHERGHELPTMEAVMPPTLVTLLCLAAVPTVRTIFRITLPARVSPPTFPCLRGPPLQT